MNAIVVVCIDPFECNSVLSACCLVDRVLKIDELFLHRFLSVAYTGNADSNEGDEQHLVHVSTSLRLW